MTVCPCSRLERHSVTIRGSPPQPSLARKTTVKQEDRRAFPYFIVIFTIIVVSEIKTLHVSPHIPIFPPSVRAASVPVCSIVPADSGSTDPMVINCSQALASGFVSPLQRVCMVHSDQRFSVLDRDPPGVVCDSCSTGVSGGCEDTVGKFSDDKLDTVTVCSQEIPELLECPQSHPAVITTCGTLSAPCGFKSDQVRCQYYGILCGNSLDTSEKVNIVGHSACDWVPFGSDFSARCEPNEVVSGLCVSDSQAGCGGAAFGGKVKCCLLSSPGCINAMSDKIWKHIAFDERCGVGTSVEAVCSVRCDPQGYFGVKNNQGMVSCGYNGFTRSQLWVSKCEDFPRCPVGSVMVSFSQCLSPKTVIKCEPVAYAAVEEDDCVTLAGDDVLVCPKGYRGKALCAPNRIRFCPGGVDTILECCRVRSYDNFGTPCTSQYVSTVVGAAASSEVELGVSGNDPLQSTSIGQPVSVATCGKGAAVFVATSNHTAIRVNLESWRVEKYVGFFDAPGYETSEWTPKSWVYNTKVDTPVSVSAVEDSHCLNMFLLEASSRIVRQIREPVSSPNYFQYSAAGHQGQLATEILTNNTKDYRAALGNVSAIAYRPSFNELYIATFGAILKLDEVNGRVSYFFGDGVTQGPKASDGTRYDRFLFHPKALAFQAEQVLYVADHDGVSASGYVSILDMKSGRISLMDNLVPACIPNALAVFQDYIMYYTAEGRHCVYYSYLTASFSGVLTGSCVGSGGYMDYVALGAAEFRYPRGVATDNDFLYVADTGNSRVRRVQLAGGTVCSSGGFDPSTGCTTCLPGYGGYPHCRTSCTIADDCSGRAWSVSGTVGSCVCVCKVGWAFPDCGKCVRGLDHRTECTLCARGYQNYPNCRTSTETLSLTETFSGDTMEISPSSTITPPPTPSRSESFATFSLDVTATLTPERTLTRAKTDTESFNETITVGRTFTKKASATITLTLTETLTTTNSLEETATPDVPRTPTPSYSWATFSPTETWSAGLTSTENLTLSEPDTTITVSLSPTITPPPTPTKTLSWPLIRPRVSVKSNALFPMGNAISRDVFNSEEESSRELEFGISGGRFDITEVPRVVAREEDRILEEILRSLSDATTTNADPDELLLQRRPYLDRFTRICIRDIYLLHVPLNSTQVDVKMKDYALRVAIQFNRTQEDVLESLSREAVAKEMLGFSDDRMVERLRISLLNADTISENTNRILIRVARPDGNFFNTEELFLHLRLSPDCFHGKFGPEEPVVVRLVPLPPPPALDEKVRIAATAVSGLWSGLASAMFQSAGTFIFFSSVAAYDLAECLQVPTTGPLPWFIHPFHFPVGHDDDPLRYYNSAMIMMTCFPIFVVFVHFVISHFYAEDEEQQSASRTTAIGAGTLYLPTTTSSYSDDNDGVVGSWTGQGSGGPWGQERRPRYGRPSSHKFSPLQASLIVFRFPSYGLILVRWCCAPAVFSAVTVASYRGKMQLVGYVVLILWAIYVLLHFAFFRSFFAAIFERYTLVDRPTGMKRFIVPYGFWRDARLNGGRVGDSKDGEDGGDDRARAVKVTACSSQPFNVDEDDHNDDARDRTGFCRRWSPMFQTVRPYGLSIVPVDLALSFLLSVVHGVYYGLGSASSCMTMAACEGVICAVHLLFLIFLRPFSIPLANVVSVLGVGFVVATLAVVLMREELNEGTEDVSFHVVVWMALGGGGILVQVILSIPVLFAALSAAREWWLHEVDTVLIRHVAEASDVAIGPSSEQRHRASPHATTSRDAAAQWSVWDKVVPTGYPFLSDTSLPSSLLSASHSSKRRQRNEQSQLGVNEAEGGLVKGRRSFSPIYGTNDNDRACGDRGDEELLRLPPPVILREQGWGATSSQQHRHLIEDQQLQQRSYPPPLAKEDIVLDADDEQAEEHRCVRQLSQPLDDLEEIRRDMSRGAAAGDGRTHQSPPEETTTGAYVSDLMAASSAAIPKSWHQQHPQRDLYEGPASPIPDGANSSPPPQQLSTRRSPFPASVEGPEAEIAEGRSNSTRRHWYDAYREASSSPPLPGEQQGRIDRSGGGGAPTSVTGIRGPQGHHQAQGGEGKTLQPRAPPTTSSPTDLSSLIGRVRARLHDDAGAKDRSHGRRDAVEEGVAPSPRGGASQQTRAPSTVKFGDVTVVHPTTTQCNERSN